MTTHDSRDDRRAKAPGRKPYSPPKLVVFGDVRLLTRSGATSKSEGSPTFKKSPTGSDRRLKENIVPIGTHSEGVGLYIFQYRAEFRDAMGHGAHLGVMADEVEAVMPEAVTVDASGYRHVDYLLLDRRVPEVGR